MVIMFNSYLLYNQDNACDLASFQPSIQLLGEARQQQNITPSVEVGPSIGATFVPSVEIVASSSAETNVSCVLILNYY